MKAIGGLKVLILRVEGLCSLFSENKGADQNYCYCEFDLPLCFHILQEPVCNRGAHQTPPSFLSEINKKMHVKNLLI